MRRSWLSICWHGVGNRRKVRPVQGLVVVELCKTLLLSLDDLLALTHEFSTTGSPAPAWNRYLWRHGVSRLEALRPKGGSAEDAQQGLSRSCGVEASCIWACLLRVDKRLPRCRKGHTAPQRAACSQTDEERIPGAASQMATLRRLVYLIEMLSNFPNPC